MCLIRNGKGEEGEELGGGTAAEAQEYRRNFFNHR